MQRVGFEPRHERRLAHDRLMSIFGEVPGEGGSARDWGKLPTHPVCGLGEPLWEHLGISNLRARFVKAQKCWDTMVEHH